MKTTKRIFSEEEKSWKNLTQAGTGSFRLSFLEKKLMISLGLNLIFNIAQSNLCLCSIAQSTMCVWYWVLVASFMLLCDQFHVLVTIFYCCMYLVTNFIFMWRASSYLVTSFKVPCDMTSFKLPCNKLIGELPGNKLHLTLCDMTSLLGDMTSFKLPGHKLVGELPCDKLHLTLCDMTSLPGDMTSFKFTWWQACWRVSLWQGLSYLQKLQVTWWQACWRVTL